MAPLIVDAKKTSKQIRPRQTAVPEDVEIEIAEVGEDRLAIISWPVVPRSRVSSLSSAEEAVLRGVAIGKSNAEIARAEFVSEATVRTHVRAILQKLGVRSQLAAVARARDVGWEE